MADIELNFKKMPNDGDNFTDSGGVFWFYEGTHPNGAWRSRPPCHEPSTPPVTTPDLTALFYDPVTFEMKGVVEGTGPIGVVHPNTVYAKDYQGTYQRFPTGSLVWAGGRCVLSAGPGSDVTAVYADDGTGTLLPQVPYLIGISEQYNRCQYSKDLSNWDITGNVTRVQDVVGLDGVTDCYTVGDADAGAAYLSRGVGMGAENVNDPKTAKVWIKAQTGVTSLPAVSTWLSGTDRNRCTCNPETGVIQQVGAVAGANNREASYYDALTDCWVFLIETTDSLASVTSMTIRFDPAYATVDGGTDPSAQGEVEVLNIEAHNDPIEALIGLPPIYVEAAQATGEIAAVEYTIPAANHDNSNGVWYAEVITKTPASEGFGGTILGVNANPIIDIAGDAFSAEDGVNVSTVTRDYAAETMVRVATNFYVGSSSEMQITVEDTEAIVGPYDGDFGIDDLNLIIPETIIGVRNLHRYATTDFAYGQTIVAELMGTVVEPPSDLVTTALVVDTRWPNLVGVTFNKELINNNDFVSGMTVTLNGDDIIPTLGRFKNVASPRNTINLYLDRTVMTGDVLTLSYSSASGSYESTSNDILSSFVDVAIDNQAVSYPQLVTEWSNDDYKVKDPAMGNFDWMKAPKTFVSESSTPSPGEAALKYDILANQAVAFSALGNAYQAAQANGITDIGFFRMQTFVHCSELAYYQNTPGDTQGHFLPCAITGPSTTQQRQYLPGNPDSDPDGYQGDPANGSFFAGHWVYQAEQLVLTSQVQNTGGNITCYVNGNVNNITQNRYVCIRNGANNWTNAVHRKVISKNASNNSIVLGPPYMIPSPSVSNHPTGSVISQHSVYNNHAEHWMTNMTTACPVDGNGNQLWQVGADFLLENMNYDHKGRYVECNITGIAFDVDREIEFIDSLMDVNNDGIADRGFVNGINVWGNGVSSYYSRLRGNFPAMPIQGGDAWALDSVNDLQSIQGTQEEGYPTGEKERAPYYSRVTSWTQNYIGRCHNQAYPVMDGTMTKQGTVIYPTNNTSYPNSIWRLAMSGILMDNGVMSHQSYHEFDTWYDEMGVLVEPGLANYGTAADKSNWEECRAARGWLGEPLGQHRRLYNDDFDPSKNLLSNGDFETDTSGWSDIGIMNSQRVTDTSMVGSASLYLPDPAPENHSYTMTSYGVRHATVSNLVVGQIYTLVYSAKASKARWIKLQFNGLDSDPMVFKDWHRYTATFVATSNSTVVNFYTGRRVGDLWLDDVGLYRGNADVMVRDYEGGKVIHNGQDIEAVIELEGDDFMRINGSQDPQINNGAVISWSQITLPPHDGIILPRGDQSVIAI